LFVAAMSAIIVARTKPKQEASHKGKPSFRSSNLALLYAVADRFFVAPDQGLVHLRQRFVHRCRHAYGA
jgi:hypothetical protein